MFSRFGTSLLRQSIRRVPVAARPTTGKKACLSPSASHPPPCPPSCVSCPSLHTSVKLLGFNHTSTLAWMCGGGSWKRWGLPCPATSASCLLVPTRPTLSFPHPFLTARSLIFILFPLPRVTSSCPCLFETNDSTDSFFPLAPTDTSTLTLPLPTTHPPTNRPAFPWRRRRARAR